MAAAVAIGLTLAGATIAAAQPDAAQQLDVSTSAEAAEREAVVLPDLSLAQLLPDSTLFHPDVMAQVEINRRPVRSLILDLTRAYVDRDDASLRRTNGYADRRELINDRREHQIVLDQRRANKTVAIAAEQEAHDNVGLYGLSTFVGNVELDLEKFSIDGISSPVPELTDSAEEVLTQRLASARADLAARRLAVADAEQTMAEIEAALAEAENRIEVAEADLEDASLRIDDLVPRFERSLAAQTVAGTDIPLVVLDAYFTAQIRTSETRPSCAVSWDQLAGIGLIETRHGSFGGSTVGPDGTTSSRILGPVLNGDPFAAISDTDGGQLDGNTEWDRAVGPMQFIPGSWKIYRQDGNSDGVMNPHNMYDAALAATEHLCRSRDRLDSDGNYQIALLGYNRSAQYGIDVMAARARYLRAVDLVPSPPVVEEEPVELVEAVKL